jgi:UDP-N-acetylglucosamine 2-epimerase
MAKVLVGNSSAGLIETPYFRIPAVNVGKRQQGRLHAENVIHAAHDVESIRNAIKKSLDDDFFNNNVKNCSQPFGGGGSGERMVSILKEIALDDKLIDKRMTY